MFCNASMTTQELYEVTSLSRTTSNWDMPNMNCAGSKDFGKTGPTMRVAWETPDRLIALDNWSDAFISWSKSAFLRGVLSAVMSDPALLPFESVVDNPFGIRRRLTGFCSTKLGNKFRALSCGADNIGTGCVRWERRISWISSCWYTILAKHVEPASPWCFLHNSVLWMSHCFRKHLWSISEKRDRQTRQVPNAEGCGAWGKSAGRDMSFFEIRKLPLACGIIAVSACRVFTLLFSVTLPVLHVILEVKPP